MALKEGEGQIGTRFRHPVRLNIFALEGLDNLPDDLRSDRSASTQEDTQASIVVAVDIRVVYHEVEHRGDQISNGHLLPLDRFENGFWVEVPDDHVSAAHPGDSPGGPRVGEVEEGRHVDPDVAIGEVELCDGPQSVDVHILVGEHNPFRFARCSAGIIDLGRILISDRNIDRLVGTILLLKYRVVGQIGVYALACPEDPCDTWNLCPYGIHLILEHWIDHQQLRL